MSCAESSCAEYMSNLLHISYVYVHILYHVVYLLFIFFICTNDVAFAFTFHVCLGTVICSFFLFVENHYVVLYKCTKKKYIYI